MGRWERVGGEYQEGGRRLRSQLLRKGVLGSQGTERLATRTVRKAPRPVRLSGLCPSPGAVASGGRRTEQPSNKLIGRIRSGTAPHGVLLLGSTAPPLLQACPVEAEREQRNAREREGAQGTGRREAQGLRLLPRAEGTDWPERAVFLERCTGQIGRLQAGQG